MCNPYAVGCLFFVKIYICRTDRSRTEKTRIFLAGIRRMLPSSACKLLVFGQSCVWNAYRIVSFKFSPTSQHFTTIQYIKSDAMLVIKSWARQTILCFFLIVASQKLWSKNRREVYQNLFWLKQISYSLDIGLYEYNSCYTILGHFSQESVNKMCPPFWDTSGRWKLLL